MIQLMTTEETDCHLHTITYSDGFNSVDEMVIWAGKAGLKKIVITDHCQFHQDRTGYSKKTSRNLVNRYKNIHNIVAVEFGVEGDIMNEQGDICIDIQGITSDFVILSTHKKVYAGDPDLITQAYIKAIERFADKIKFLGHLCSIYYEKYLDVEPVIDAALANGVAFELNCANLANNKTNMANLKKMLAKAKNLWVNSDAHTLEELLNLRQIGYHFLQENDLIPSLKLN